MADSDDAVSIQEIEPESKGLPHDLTREFLCYYDHFGMIRRSRQFMALGLALTLLWVGTAVGVQLFDHASHHAQHQSKTHATVLCSWLCAAGQGVEAVSLHIDSTPTLLTLIAPQPVDRHTPPALNAFQSRGPPPLA
ncbi:MAG TPA: hypothetical protein VFA38_08605 [Nitrospirales bacterium]|nr:hypothetical protein [Nitrospirales bacterium]